MRMRELWIPLIMDKHDEKPVWARCWVGYRCLTPATSLGPSSFVINPINQLLTDRVQRMKHNFRQRNEDAEKAENIQLLQAIRKLSTEVFDTIQKNAMEIRLGHEALVEKIRHGNDASTSRGLALYSVGEWSSNLAHVEDDTLESLREFLSSPPTYTKPTQNLPRRKSRNNMIAQRKSIVQCSLALKQAITWAPEPTGRYG